MENSIDSIYHTLSAEKFFQIEGYSLRFSGSSENSIIFPFCICFKLQLKNVKNFNCDCGKIQCHAQSMLDSALFIQKIFIVIKIFLYTN